ncbi:hypothetical protein BS47DRAFT_1368995 [Hydnum rufescens UP504]|uniref:Uncharacterized protein n=1 Tax=Hydnum rufescens UP504 TaxID=1448309 RepID=A0A9P6DGH2_9AGAM|nr:hypothetical protein BS47DRAFT_1368995 [Hydnum rufescens UP504]
MASGLAASNADVSHAMTANPIDASRSGSLAASKREILPRQALSNGVLASDSTAHAGREGCLPTEDKIPLTWDEKGEVVQYPVGRHNAVVPFPHRVVWGLSHDAVAQKFKAPSKATRIYNISEWSLVIFSFRDIGMAPKTFTTRQAMLLGLVPDLPPHFSHRLHNHPPYVQQIGPMKFFKRSETVYEGWKSIATDWLNGASLPRTPVKPDWMNDQSMQNAFTSIVDQPQPQSHVTSLLFFAYECNGYASYLMHCCIDRLLALCEVPHPTFGVDDRVVGAVFKDPLGSEEVKWRDELVGRGIPVWVVRELWTRQDTFPDRHGPEDIASAQTCVDQAKRSAKSLIHHHIHLQVPVTHVEHPVLWRMLPQAYYEGDRDEPFIQSVWDSFLFSGSMGTPYLTKVRLDDLRTVFGPGVFPKPSAPVISPPSAPPAPEITMGDPSQLNLPSATLAPEINMDDPYRWNSDEEEDEDDYDDRKKEEVAIAKQRAAAQALMDAAYGGDIEAQLSLQKALRDAKGKKYPHNA